MPKLDLSKLKSVDTGTVSQRAITVDDCFPAPQSWVNELRDSFDSRFSTFLVRVGKPKAGRRHYSKVWGLSRGTAYLLFDKHAGHLTPKLPRTGDKKNATKKSDVPVRDNGKSKKRADLSRLRKAGRTTP